MRFGRKPAVHTRRTMRSALIMAKALDALGGPPDLSNDYISAVVKQAPAGWGMMDNDSLGDCVCADTGHALMLRTANVGPSIVVPTDADIVSLYEAVGGYSPSDPSTDQGCDETAMCQYLETTGFLGHKSDAAAMVDVSNLAHVKWVVQLFGTCRIGFNVPAYAMTQFNNGQPWDLDPSGDQTVEGGHDVPIVGYKGDDLVVVTWGQIQHMTPAFLAQWADEAHAELFADWIAVTGVAPSGLDLTQLTEDLQALQQ